MAFRSGFSYHHTLSSRFPLQVLVKTQQSFPFFFSLLSGYSKDTVVFLFFLFIFFLYSFWFQFSFFLSLSFHFSLNVTAKMSFDEVSSTNDAASLKRHASTLTDDMHNTTLSESSTSTSAAKRQRQTTSIVWKFFRKAEWTNETKRAKCILCERYTYDYQHALGFLQKQLAKTKISSSSVTMAVQNNHYYIYKQSIIASIVLRRESL